MKRSGSKPGIQRRRSSGILKLGRLRLRDVPTPAKNAVFSFTSHANTDDGGTDQASTNSPAKLAASSRLSHDTALPLVSANRGAIPLPSSHIHRTASEINLIFDQKTAAARERVMFQRIVSGMVSRQHERQITLSVKVSAATTNAQAKHTIRSDKKDGKSCTESHPVPLSVANASSQRLLESITPRKENSDVETTTHPGFSEVDDYFIDPFENDEGAARQMNLTIYNLNTQGKEACSDSEEFFPLDL